MSVHYVRGEDPTLREAALGLWLTVAAGGAVAEPIHADDKRICAWAVGTVERIYRLPDRLMVAIALAESGPPDLGIVTLPSAVAPWL